MHHIYRFFATLSNSVDVCSRRPHDLLIDSRWSSEPIVCAKTRTIPRRHDIRIMDGLDSMLLDEVIYPQGTDDSLTYGWQTLLGIGLTSLAGRERLILDNAEVFDSICAVLAQLYVRKEDGKHVAGDAECKASKTSPPVPSNCTMLLTISAACPPRRKAPREDEPCALVSSI
jgi:hypothetical protein